MRRGRTLLGGGKRTQEGTRPRDLNRRGRLGHASAGAADPNVQEGARQSTTLMERRGERLRREGRPGENSRTPAYYFKRRSRPVAVVSSENFARLFVKDLFTISSASSGSIA